jgi:hypothetical protein
MKLLHVLFTCGLLLAAAPSQAASGKSTISRGGLGFLFPDHNNFNNIGQTALDKGTSIELDYGVTPVTGASNVQMATPSIVFSTGSFGLGAFVQRSGTSLTETANKTDTVGAGLGFALAKQRLTIGVQGYRSIDIAQSSDGTVGASLAWNGDKRVGFTAGAGVTTTLNQANEDTRAGTVALGWGFNPMTKVEVVAKLNNLSDTNDYDLGGYLTYEGNVFYFSGGYNYLAQSKDSQVRGRAGLAFGKFDLSAFVDYTIVDGGSPAYGGTARVTF